MKNPREVIKSLTPHKRQVDLLLFLFSEIFLLRLNWLLFLCFPVLCVVHNKVVKASYLLLENVYQSDVNILLVTLRCFMASWCFHLFFNPFCFKPTFKSCN